MSVPGDYMQELFQKLVSNECTEQEAETFFQLVRDLPDDDALIAQLDAWWEKVDAGESKDLVRERRIWQQIREQTNPEEANPEAPVRWMHRRSTWWVAASMAVLITAGAFLWLQPKETTTVTRPSYASSLAPDIQPGKDGAVLILEDGRKIVLDSLHDGVIASQRGAEILLKDGKLAYNEADAGSKEPAWNTIATPVGRQFKMTLRDGTQVWLNASSSITYPTFFAGNERRVEVTGEVYMEVAKNPDMKFKVKVNDQAVVEVTGTQFNVKAYADEPSIATTLLEGSVNLYRSADTSCWHCPGANTGTIAATSSVTLRPGQQGVIATNGKQHAKKKGNSEILVLKDIDTDKILAWKNGFFNFTGMSPREAMNQLVRWYNIEVVYEDAVPDIEFFGDLRRDMSLADLLTALEVAGVQFRVVGGRKLIVLPK